jgi:hypothetical protein
MHDAFANTRGQCTNEATSTNVAALVKENIAQRAYGIPKILEMGL